MKTNITKMHGQQHIKIRNILVCIVTRQRAGRSGFEIQAGATEYSLLHKAQNGSPVKCVPGLFIVLRLRMSGAIYPLVPVCLNVVGRDSFTVLCASTVHWEERAEISSVLHEFRFRFISCRMHDNSLW